MMKLGLTVFGLLIVGCLIFGAVSSISGALEQRNAEKAAAEQAELIQSQAILEELPDWGQTLIITIGALYGMQTFGPKLMLAASLTILGGLVIIIIFVMQAITLFSRPPHPSAYAYSFKASLIISGILVVVAGAMLYNLPGGGAFVIKMSSTAAVLGFFLAGGGVAFRFNGGKFTSTTDEHGNMSTNAEAPSGGVIITGPGRNANTTGSDTLFK
jgi:hypothetical protein